MKKLSTPLSTCRELFRSRALAAIAASTVSLLITGLPAAVPVHAAPAETPLVRLPGHMLPGALSKAALLGRINAGESLSLTLALPLRDPVGMNNLLQRLYAPGDPLFHHFLATGEFDRRFGPTQQTYNSVAAFARANGLEVKQTQTSRLFLQVSGPSSVVESAFRVHLRNYESTDGRVFHAPDADPGIPSAMVGKISGVIGLQNSNVLHTNFHYRSPSLRPAVGSGPDGGLTPTDIKTAYNLNSTTLTGSGRTLALYELDGYTASDISSYEAKYSLPAVPLQNILIDGASGIPSDPTVSEGPVEVTLDIELMTALAPDATSILVYEAPNGGPGEIDCYDKIASDNLAKEISSSWGLSEDQVGQATQTAENTIFEKMQAQGQTLYAAAGDTGAYDDPHEANPTVDDPASQPLVTGVGGTRLSTAGRGGVYQTESAWGIPSTPSGGGGGGGISDFWPLPTYQTDITSTNDVVSTTQRNVPDVSLDADPDTGYSFYFGGWGVVGGTSCAAPLWAAFTALVNQQRILNGQTAIGFINPALYAIGTGTSYTTAYHDVLDGSTNLLYASVPGYDNATGWGSFNGANMIALLAPATVINVNPIASLTLTPTSVVGGLTAQGTVTLTNPAPAGDATVALSSSNSSLVPVPATVIVTAGTSSATFVVTTTAVTAPASVTVTATYSGGPKSAILTVLPPPAIITPVSLAFSPSSVGNGASSVGTVALSGPAPTGGLTVSLSSSDPAASVPATVLVPAGSVSAQFPVTTVPVTTQVVATISATLNSVTKTATITVQAPKLEPIGLTPVSVIGGQASIATLTLTYPAPADGATVTLSSSDPTAVIPANVTIPAGQTVATVSITTSIVPATITSTIIGSYAGVTQKTVLTIDPILPIGLTITPASVIGGASATGTVTLNAPVPVGSLTVSLTTTDVSAQIPASVLIPAGASSASFAIPTAAVTAPISAQITASLDGSDVSAPLAIQPVQISAFTLNPVSTLAGTPVTGTITLNAPAPVGGLVITLSSSGTAATVPASVPVPTGASTVTFSVATPHAGGVVISASLLGATQTAPLTIAAAPGTTFPAGLNMLSSPYDYTGVSLDTLFGYTGVVLANWQTATGAYFETPTAPSDAMHIGRGYWVNLPTAVTFSTIGTPADTTHDFTIALLPGWNQIGDPFLTTVRLGSVSLGTAAASFDQASTAAPLLVSGLVYRYAPKSGTTAGSYVWVRDTDTLQPGLGYWVYAYSAVTLTIPHP
ncbi:MAG: protease pro-enzyme activation domain-containing protein [Janthinobacterium lividum]